MSLRPTVIHSGPAPAAAADAAPGPVSPLRPTVIGSMAGSATATATGEAAAAIATPQPTVLPSALPRTNPPPPVDAGRATPVPGTTLATAMTSAPARAATPPASAVTRVRGVERKGLSVEAAALRQRHPDASDAAIDQAVLVLGGVVPQTCTASTLENLGRTAQEGVARLVDRALQVADSEASRGAARHIERLLELLGELAETLQPASGLNWRRKTLRQALAHSRPELDTLRTLLEASEGTLRDHQGQLAALQQEQQQVQDGLQARLIAISELRAAFDDTRRLAALDERETALNKSAALVMSHGLQMRRLETDLAQLGERIRDAVLHALPAWLAMAASAPADALNDTDRFSLREPLYRLMRALRPSP